MDEKNCEKCGYGWLSRTEEPKACPRCKRRFDYPRVFNEKVMESFANL